MATTRKDILDSALKCVNGERDRQYGNPENNFDTIAKLWNTYLDVACYEKPIEAKDVAAMLSLLKIARIASGVPKDDNWIDLAGYAACGGEIDSLVAQRIKEDHERVVRETKNFSDISKIEE